MRNFIAALLFLLLPLTANAQSAFFIEDFYRAEDNGDWSKALARVQESYQTQPIGSPNVDKRRFKTDWRTIYFGRDFELYTFFGHADLHGARLFGTRAGVELYFNGPYGVRVHQPRYFTGAGGSHPNGYGGASRIENLTLTGSRTGTVSGVRVFAQFQAADVTVQNFGGIGWEISADHNRPDMSNTNLFGLERCAALENGSHGLFIDGGDANVGYTNRFRAEFNNGWGIWDSSFLGNLHDEPKMVHNGTGPRPKPSYPAEVQLAFRSDYQGAATVVVNPYVEGFGALVDVASPGLVIGGMGGLYSSQTRRWRGNEVTGQQHFAGPNGFARFNNPKSILDIGKPYASAAHVYSLEHENGFLQLELGRVNAQRAFALTSSTSASGGRKLEQGRLAITQGWYEGPTFVKRMLGPGAPPAPTADMGVGSTWTTTLPAKGQTLTWILLKPATEFIWVPLHVIPE